MTIYLFILIQYFFFVSVSANYNITFILLAAPKKIPMLTYTIEYFLHAYEFNHNDINVDGFYMIKGNPGSFPEMENAIDLLKKASIPVYYNEPTYDWYEGTETHKKFQNYYMRFWGQYCYNFWKGQNYGSVNKESLVNYYFFQTIEVIKKNKNGYPDHIIFLEDDVAMKKTSFIELKRILDEHYENESAIKIAIPGGANPNDGKHFTLKWSCPWGYWGTLYSKEQFYGFDKIKHFLPYGYCGDQFHCMMVWFYDRRIRIDEIWYHFGRDSDIRRRDPRFWNT